MHSPCLKIVAEAKGMEGRKRERVEDDGWVGAEREREGGGREMVRERDKEREEEVLWAPSSSHYLSGMLITSHLPGQPGDGYVSSEHLLFEISVLALFLRKISTSVFFHL